MISIHVHERQGDPEHRWHWDVYINGAWLAGSAAKDAKTARAACGKQLDRIQAAVDEARLNLENGMNSP